MAVIKKKTIPFLFSQKHIDYIRKCQECTYNIAEGAVRSGKTVANIFAFAQDLKTAPDKLHLATGSTASNAKLNIGDANGFGLEYIFRGQSHWGKYKGNDCLYIKGPATDHKQKVIIFAGAALANSFKKIRGNSYGMWIATEINLHHDNSIKEAFNRLLAAKRRKIFWDLNPDHPKAAIYKDYIDKYAELNNKGELLGGYNYEHFTIFDNINISEESRKEFLSQYDKTSIWYMRDIEGKRCVAEGLIYKRFAADANSENNPLLLSIEDTQEMAKNEFISITIAVDFGGNGSGHAFVATAITRGYKKLIGLSSERHFGDDIDPDALGKLFVTFVQKILFRYGYITYIYADSAEQVLIRGLDTSLATAGLGNYIVDNAYKRRITDRIHAFEVLTALRRFYYTDDCKTLEEAICSALWNPKETKLVRLDDGTSDIDTMDAFEYTYEREIGYLLDVGR